MSQAAIETKKVKVSELSKKLSECQSIVLYDYRGLTVQQATDLRNEFRKEGVEYKVIKNSIVVRAAEQIGWEGLDEYLKGPTAVAFGVNDPVAPAKILNDYVKKIKKTEIKAGVVEGKVIDAKGVVALAELPPRDVLIAKMLGSMNAPITGLVSVLSGTIRQLVTALDAIKEKKEA